MTAFNTPPGHAVTLTGRAGTGAGSFTPVPGTPTGSVFPSTPGVDAAFWTAFYTAAGVSQVPASGQLWPRGY